METLPYDMMRIGYAYTYVGGAKEYSHYTQRKNVVKRVKQICDQLRIRYSEYTPESLIGYAHLMFACDEEGERDRFIVINGSNRLHVFTCVVVAPWNGAAFELAGGSSLEGDFSTWLAEMASSIPKHGGGEDDQDRMKAIVGAICTKYFFRARKVQ